MSNQILALNARRIYWVTTTRSERTPPLLSTFFPRIRLFMTATERGWGCRKIKTLVYHDQMPLPVFPLPAGRSTPCQPWDKRLSIYA